MNYNTEDKHGEYLHELIADTYRLPITGILFGVYDESKKRHYRSVILTNFIWDIGPKKRLTL